MAKDTEEEKTVPLYKPDGTLMGYTTPEKYAQINEAVQASPDFVAPDFEYSTGFSSDNQYVKVYNPVTGQMDVIPTGGDWLAWNPKNDNTSWGFDPDGNRVLMRTDIEGWEDYTAFNPEYEGIQAGYQPEDTVYTKRDLSLGDRPNEDGSYGKDETVEAPTTKQPGDYPTSGGGGSTGGGGGSYGGSSGFDPTYSGPSGTQGVAPDVDLGEGAPGDGYFDPQGFGNSTNEDFYAFQSSAQRVQALRNAMREQQARKNAQEAANAPAPEPTDPWAWAGGGDQFKPIIGTDMYDPNGDMIRNPNAPWEVGTSNADLLRQFSDFGVFDKYDSDRMNEWINSQDKTGSTNWSTWDANSGNPNPFLNGNPFIDDLFNAMWVNPGDIREFGQPTTPYGYASPLSPTSAAKTGA